VETDRIENLKTLYPQCTMRVIQASLEDIFVTLTLHIMSLQAAEQARGKP